MGSTLGRLRHSALVKIVRSCWSASPKSSSKSKHEINDTEAHHNPHAPPKINHPAHCGDSLDTIQRSLHSYRFSFPLCGGQNYSLRGGQTHSGHVHVVRYHTERAAPRKCSRSSRSRYPMKRALRWRQKVPCHKLITTCFQQI